MRPTVLSLDSRRKIIIPGDAEASLTYAAEKWITYAKEAIADHGFFAVALSGGSTPKKIYQHISSHFQEDPLDWSKVFLFWGDERSVSPHDPESNYHMAMEEGGFSSLPLEAGHIFRMVAEESIEENADSYEKTILARLGSHPFDLVMLGMGEDGHTASLFPGTAALQETHKLVVANYVPQKNTWRMTVTFPCIHSARNICFYVFGENKADLVAKILSGSPETAHIYPSFHVGTATHPALWVLDSLAAKKLPLPLKSL